MGRPAALKSFDLEWSHEQRSDGNSWTRTYRTYGVSLGTGKNAFWGRCRHENGRLGRHYLYTEDTEYEGPVVASDGAFANGYSLPIKKSIREPSGHSCFVPVTTGDGWDLNFIGEYEYTSFNAEFDGDLRAPRYIGRRTAPVDGKDKEYLCFRSEGVAGKRRAGQWFDWYVDPQTHVPEIFEKHYGDGDTDRVRFLDFRKIGPLLVPFIERHKSRDLIVRRLNIDADLNASLFVVAGVTCSYWLPSPSLLRRGSDPVYTAAAQQANAHPEIPVDVIVDETGTPVSVTILKRAGYGLDEEVSKALMTWRFRALGCSGPARLHTRFSISF